MVALLHCIIIDIENTRIRNILQIWQSKKNISKYNMIIFEKIKIFKYFSKVSLYLSHFEKIENKEYCWGRNW